MNVLSLMAVLRKVFSGREIPEFPSFPVSLVESWCHPDLFLSMAGRTFGQCFIFQTFATSDGFLADTAIKTPDLIWLVDKADLPLSKGVPDFLVSLRHELVPGREDADFAIISDSRRKLGKGEAGAFWKILFAGVECGRLSLYSAIPGSSLSDSGAAVVTLQLNILAALLSPVTANEPARWADNITVSGALALRAWQHSEDNTVVNDKQLLELLNKALVGSEIDAAGAFCRMFKLYNQHAQAINKNADLCQTFVARTGALSSALLALTAGDTDAS